MNYSIPAEIRKFVWLLTVDSLTYPKDLLIKARRFEAKAKVTQGSTASRCRGPVRLHSVPSPGRRFINKCSY